MKGRAVGFVTMADAPAEPPAPELKEFAEFPGEKMSKAYAQPLRRPKPYRPCQARTIAGVNAAGLSHRTCTATCGRTSRACGRPRASPPPCSRCAVDLVPGSA